MIDPQMYTWMEGHGLVLRLRYAPKGTQDDCQYWWAATFETPAGFDVYYSHEFGTAETPHTLAGHSLEPTQAVLELLRLTSDQYLTCAAGSVKMPRWNLTSTQESVG